MRLRDALADLLLGAECVGCRRAGWGLCHGCRHELCSHPQLRQVGELTVVSSCDYTSTTAAIITSWKDHGSWGTTRPLVAASDVALASTHWRPEVVVAVPSAPSAVRERGFDHAQALARGIASRHGWPNRRWLRRRRGGFDQADLDREQRWRNQQGRFTATAAASAAGPARVLIVDDLVTTGATLTAAAQALSSAGHVVVGALTVADAHLTAAHTAPGSH